MSKIKTDGWIKKGKECEFTEYCSKAGSRCSHTGENRKSDYHCGYCKAFRYIELTQDRKLGEKR